MTEQREQHGIVALQLQEEAVPVRTEWQGRKKGAGTESP